MTLKRALLLSALVPAAAAWSTEREIRDLPLSEVLSRHIEAMGGEAAHRGIQSLRIDATVALEDGPTHRVTILKARPNLFRATFRASDWSLTRGFDGEDVWTLLVTDKGHHAKPLDPFEEKLIARRAPIENLLLRTRELDAETTLVGTERLVNRPVYRVRVDFGDGHIVDHLIDGGDFVLRRVEQTEPRATGERVTTLIPSNYQYVGGVLFPWREIQLSDGERHSVITVQDMEINPGVLYDAFRPPPER
ncbi:MAG: hypothetical protein JJU00_14705 [Opitutales bacterium]|nr:hypothetical protein [Opitutales bacterium]